MKIKNRIRLLKAWLIYKLWPWYHSTICHHTGWVLKSDGLHSRKSPFMRFLHEAQVRLICDPLDMAYHLDIGWYKNILERQWQRSQK